ncbi:MAG: VOC family protein [Hyphomonadaceae bacterium]|jgi:predicted 3-demethylubiquinone-9 3-methyltransferase (glyoxalase superfamily)|nr:VOC family protein [Hyphomonadaceae bacterium]
MAWLGSKVRTCWWFAQDGEKAADFYVSLLPDSFIEGGHGPEGGPPLVIEFTLAGTPMMILNAQGAPAPTHQASFSVLCDDQAEVDRLWTALLADGGKEVYCGWVTDRFGVSWQIVPRCLPEMLASPDRTASDRALKAMQGMVKLDIAALQSAFAGDAS